jgi:HEAT repeat protein
VLKVLKDPNADVRNNAAGILGLLGDSNVLPTLLEISRDSDAGVGMTVAWALGNIGDPSVIPAVVERLQDTEKPYSRKRVCDAAAKALEQIGTAAALAAVKEWRAAGNA